MTTAKTDIIDCIDIFAELKDTQWLIQSMQDAISNHWEEKELVEHLSFLISIYGEKIEEIIPRLDAAFEKVHPSITGFTDIYSIEGQN